MNIKRYLSGADRHIGPIRDAPKIPEGPFVVGLQPTKGDNQPTVNRHDLGCYKGCFYYTDSCFRKDCQKGKIMTKIADLTPRQLSWLITLIELERAEKAGEHVKRWFAEAVRKGEQVDPYVTDWLWAGPIIDREDIDLWKDAPGDFAASVGPVVRGIHGPTKLMAAMRCYAHKVKGDLCELPQHLRKPA